jgi:hypothetical protein
MGSPALEIVFVDVDDTLVRSAGSKRIPIAAVLDRVRMIDDQPPAEWRLCRCVHPFNVASIDTEA